MTNADRTSSPRVMGFDRLSDKTYEKLHQSILAGKFTAGERLVELKISKTLKVGRTPLREALLRLSADGLVECMPGTGFFVRSLTLTDLEEIFQIRASLECLAVRLAVQRGFSEIKLLEMRQSCEQLRAGITAGNGNLAGTADLDFHRALIGLANSRRLETAIRSSHLQMLAWETRRCAVMGFDDEKVVDEHLGILAALQKRDGELAAKLLNDHITVAFQVGLKAAVEQKMVGAVLNASVPVGDLT